MSVAEILQELPKLSVAERDEVRRRLAELEDDAWDRQIEADANGGKLDKLWAEALDDIKAGRTKPLDEVIGDA
jgi:predicted ATPase